VTIIRAQLICPDKHLWLLVWEGDDPIDEIQPVSDDPPTFDDHEMECLTLNYRALDPRELTCYITIKLEGDLLGYSILFLVDSGATL